MTTTAKMTYLVAMIVGLCGGAIFGFRHRSEVLRSRRSITSMNAVKTLRHFIYLQYKYADFERAEDSLQTLTNLLEQMERLNPEKEHQYDLADAYTHMALLADAAGKTEQSRDDLKKAQFWYQATGSRKLTDSQLKSAVKAKDAMQEALLLD